MIPKIIHYCWLSDDPIPENLQSCIKSWKEILPEYEFVKWDFNRFEKSSSCWVSDAFDNKKYAFAADYIRLFAIYNYGGIYMDMDIEVKKSFNDLLDSTYMMAYERPSCNGIEAGCFGAEKGSSFIKVCLDSYEGKKFVLEDGSFNQTPLPFIMKKCYEESEFDFRIYNHNFFTAKSYETGKITITDETYCIHHFAGSWKSQAEKKIISDTIKYSSFLGFKVGRNLAEYKNELFENGIKGIMTLTRRKITHKLKISKDRLR